MYLQVLNNRMVLVVNFFVFSKLHVHVLFFALLLLMISDLVHGVKAI